MAREIEAYRRTKSKDLFTGAQKKLVEAWAHGFQKPIDIAAHLGVKKDTAKHTGEIIKDKMYEGPGTDREAKAVALAAQNGWIDPTPYPDRLERKLTESEVQALALRTRGFTRKEVADQLKYSEDEVNTNLDAVQQLIGVKTDYGAIAWAILKVLKRPQTQEPDGLVLWARTD